MEAALHITELNAALFLRKLTVAQLQKYSWRSAEPGSSLPFQYNPIQGYTEAHSGNTRPLHL
jgi:acyl-homoserine lactone acylase PvdQ